MNCAMFMYPSLCSGVQIASTLFARVIGDGLFIGDAHAVARCAPLGAGGAHGSRGSEGATASGPPRAPARRKRSVHVGEEVAEAAHDGALDAVQVSGDGRICMNRDPS